MALLNEFKLADGYVYFHVTGEEESLDDYHNQAKEIFEYCEKANFYNVLIDETDAISRFTVMQEYEMSYDLLEDPKAVELKRIAWIGKFDRYEYAKVFESFALINDVQFKVFRRRSVGCVEDPYNRHSLTDVVADQVLMVLEDRTPLVITLKYQKQ